MVVTVFLSTPIIRGISRWLREGQVEDREVPGLYRVKPEKAILVVLSLAVLFWLVVYALIRWL